MGLFAFVSVWCCMMLPARHFIVLCFMISKALGMSAALSSGWIFPMSWNQSGFLPKNLMGMTGALVWMAMRAMWCDHGASVVFCWSDW